MPSLLADVLPPPTLAIDYLYLGPVGVAVGGAILAAAILTGRALRKRGRGRGAAIAAGVAVFVALDLAVYVLWITTLREPPRRPLPPIGSPGQVP